MINKSSKTQKELPSFAEEEYRSVFASAIHFSFKAVNTNAMDGGVRLSKEQSFDAPYICAQTLQYQGYKIECDYPKQEKSPPSATIFKHYRISRDGHEKEAVNSPESILAAYEESTRGHLEINTDKISPRMRQLVLPVGADLEEYVVTTPLPAAGLHKLVNEKVNEVNRAAKETPARYISRGTMGFGGSNPQNAGSLIRYMQSVLIFEAPVESTNARRALSIFYKGMDIRPKKEVMIEYRRWRSGVIERHDHATGDRKSKDIETGYIEQLCNHLLSAANQRSKCLKVSEELLPPSESLVSDDLDHVQRGLLDAKHRNHAWARATAHRFAWAIAQYPFSDGTTLGLGGDAVDAIARKAEEFIR